MMIFQSLCLQVDVMSRVSGRLANESGEPEEGDDTPSDGDAGAAGPILPTSGGGAASRRERERPTPSLSPPQQCDSLAVVPVVPLSRDRGGWLTDKQSCPACLFDAICCFPEGAEGCVQQSVHSSSKP